jgi:hypothetical protein
MQQRQYCTHCIANNAFCIPKPTPMPARIWKPISFASDVVVLSEYSSPDPRARKTGAATKKGQLHKTLSCENKNSRKRWYTLIPNLADNLPGNNDGQDCANHKWKEINTRCSGRMVLHCLVKNRYVLLHRNYQSFDVNLR